MSDLITLPRESIEILKEFEDFLNVYIEDGDLKQQTLEAYIHHTGDYLSYCYSMGIDPKVATQEDLRGYRSYLREKYKTSTIKLKFNILKRFYNRVINLGYRQDNPLSGLKAKRVENNPEDEIKYFDLEEIQTLFSSIKLNTPAKVRDYLILMLLYSRGLRVIEITRLDLSHIEHNRIKVIGKNDKIRYVGLTDTILTLLQNWLEVREAFVSEDETAIFVSTSNRSRGKRMSTRSIRYRVDHYLERIKAKQKGKSCHSFRHSFGTILATEGVSMEIIQSMLGHSKPDMTRHYSKIAQRELIDNNPAKILEDLLIPA